MTEYQTRYLDRDGVLDTISRPTWPTALASARTLGGQVWLREPGGDWERVWPR